MRELGLCGTLLCGRTREKNLDHADFRPVLRAAARLGVPVSIHPQIPQRAVRDVYYSGFGEPVDTAFAAFGLGWHYEAGIQFVRLVLAKVFDELPKLQVVLGHWGEVVLFFTERMGSLGKIAGLDRPIEEYLRRNLYVTPSGMWSDTYLQRTVEIVGAERILFSADFPYQYRPGREARTFFERAALTETEKEMFGHGNWERLIGGIKR